MQTTYNSFTSTIRETHSESRIPSNAINHGAKQPFCAPVFAPGSRSDFTPGYRSSQTDFAQCASNSQVTSERTASFRQSSNSQHYDQAFVSQRTRTEQSVRNTYDRQNDRCQKDNWSNTPVKGNKSSIDLGDYKLDLNKADSSIMLTNKKTGDTTKVWGDPHIDTNGTSNMFKGPLTFDLPNGTKATIGTKADGNVTYADKVTITRGNDAYVVNGLSEKDKNPLTVTRSNDGRRLDAQTPDGYSLVANRNGKGWVDPQTGRAPTAADFSSH
jgi:hypothetical protein